MTKGILAAVMVTTLSFSQAFACDIHGNTGFAPENSMKIYAGDKAANNMTEELFLSTVKRVSDVYESVVASKGAKLKMNNRWEDATVNASAQQSGKTWQVNMYGGLARHELVTTDGFMMVVCHELGHHLGGAPRKSTWMGTSWASNEGQSDYWAGLKCMRKVLENDDNISYVANMIVDQDVTEKCSTVYKSAQEVALCQRISMAGKSLAMVLGSLGGNSNVNFTTPDTRTVAKTNDNHPQAQCRLDTYFQGTLCDKSISEDVDATSAIPGTCVKSEGFSFGVRPLCWYKPGSAEL